MQGQVKMKYKKIIRIGVIVFILCFGFIMYSKIVFEQQMKCLIKERLSFQVREEKFELEELISEIEEKDIQGIHRSESGEGIIPYRDLKNPLIKKEFKKFHLIMIVNEQDDLENQYVDFHVYPYADLLWDGFSYGFYYSSSDEPLDVNNGGEKCESQVKGKIGGFIDYDYKTEKIATNWWYYETTVYYPEKRRR